MEIRALGPIEVFDGGNNRLDLGPRKQRVVLACLLAAPDMTRPVDQLVEALWPHDKPGNPRASLYAYVSRLRRILTGAGTSGGTPTIERDGVGYRLVPGRASIDLLEFERDVNDGLEPGTDPEVACRLLEQSLARWRGRPFEDGADVPFVADTAVRVGHLRREAEERLLDLLAGLGETSRALALAERLAGRNPLDEGANGRLMIALYQDGRQADALRHYAGTRAVLIEELGVEPTEELQKVEHLILNQDPSLRPGRLRARVAWRAAAPELHPLAGREPELSTVAAHLSSGAGSSTLLISGEPGIGKSRLLREAAQLAIAAGRRLIWVQCERGARGTGLLPVSRAVSELSDSLSEDEFEAVVGPDPAALAPLLAAGGLPAGGSQPIDVGDDVARYRLTEAVRRNLKRLTRLAPVLIVVDDGQWLTPAMVELLVALATDHQALPVTFLVATRRGSSAEAGPDLGALRRAPGFETIELQGLERSAVAQLVADRFGTDGAPIAAEVHRRTDGNPLFVTELLRALDPDDPARSLDRPDTPASVAEVVAAHLAELAPEVVDVLTVAALTGPTFEPTLCTEIAGHHERVSDLADAMLAAGLVEEASPPTLRFRHDLVMDAVAARLSHVRRAELHARIGRALLARLVDGGEGPRDRGDRSVLGQLAHHLCAGAPFGTGMDGARFAMRAAIEAMVDHDAEQARQLTELGLEALRQADASPEIAPLRLGLLCRQAKAQQRLSNHAEAHRVAFEAFELAVDGGYFDEAAEALSIYVGQGAGAWMGSWYDNRTALAMVRRLLDGAGQDGLPSSAMIRLLVAASEVTYGNGLFDESETASRDALDLAIGHGDVELLAFAIDNRLALLDATADTAERVRLCAELVSVAGEHPGFSPSGRRHLMVSKLEAGELAGAVEAIDGIDRLAIRADSDLVAYQAALCRNSLALFRGRLKLADEAMRGTRSRFAHLDPPRLDALDIQQFWLLWEVGALALAEEALRARLAEFESTSWRAPLLLVLMEDGRRDEAAALLSPMADEEFSGVQFRTLQLMTSFLLAETVMVFQDRHRAELLLQVLEPMAHRMISFYSGTLLMGWAGLPAGRLLGLVGRYDDAERLLTEARSRAESAGSVSFELRADVAMAELDVRRGVEPRIDTDELTGRAKLGGYVQIAGWWEEVAAGYR